MKKLGFFVIGLLISNSLAQTLLNVSYDPTRELYEDFNAIFALEWEAKTGQKIDFQQSHGGSGSQARAVIDGLEADVVTLALAYDIDAIANSGLIPATWQTHLPNNSSPYTSTIVFLVRKDNPKNINDWGDLIKDGVEVITPNPKTSGGARWNYLAAWAYGKKAGGDKDQAGQAFITELYKHVPVLDKGARDATTTFVEREIGDVLITWENEAFLAINQLGEGEYEIIVPSISILAEPPVTIVDTNVDKHGTREIAQAYLEFLYSEAGQEIVAKHYYRPTLKSVAEKYTNQFPTLDLVAITDFGGWQDAQAKHFAEGGIFDQIYQPQ